MVFEIPPLNGKKKEGSLRSPPKFESETGCVEPVDIATVASDACPQWGKATVPQQQAGGGDSCKGKDSDTEAANKVLPVFVI